MTIDAPGDAYEGLQLLKVDPANMRHDLSPRAEVTLARTARIVAAMVCLALDFGRGDVPF
jgi:hypothetical protein